MVASISIPGVRQVWAGDYGWSYLGGPKKFILHSTETDSAPGCVDQLCRYLDGWANPHVVWDPWTGDMAMCGRADWAGGALLAGNKDGSVVLQVEAVGRAGVAGKRPFVDSPMYNWSKILAWADSWGIPRVFPAGPSPQYPDSYGFNTPYRPVDIWNTKDGYYSHSQVPGNDHGDAGIVDLKRIFPYDGPVKEDEVTVLPTITPTDHTHPGALALWKHSMQIINPAVDLSTDEKCVEADSQFAQFFGVKMDGSPGYIGYNMWKTVLFLAGTVKGRRVE